MDSIKNIPLEPRFAVSTAVRVMLDGYKVNGGNGLSTLQFCEAQIKYMLDNGISANHPIVDEYRMAADRERMKL